MLDLDTYFNPDSQVISGSQEQIDSSFSFPVLNGLGVGSYTDQFV